MQIAALPLTTLDELIVTPTMQERKRIMQERADLFIVMLGGLVRWKRPLRRGMRSRLES